jgi:hypothetical protein
MAAERMAASKHDSPMIEIAGLTKRFGIVVAVDACR